MSVSAAMASLLTPPGRGAVAVIGCTGGLARLAAGDLFHPARGKLVETVTIGEVWYGRWGRDLPREDVLLVRTDENSFEVHCHGGLAAVERVLADLAGLGYVRTEWFDQLVARDGRLRAEATRALSLARTERTARLLERQIELLDRAARELAAVLERGEIGAARSQIRAMLAWEKFGAHLVEPWRVVIAGRPNVGKSRLINGLLGYERSIVYDRPGTTRDVVTAETAFDGWPVELRDTAGLRSSEDELESAGIARAEEALREADLCVLVFDGSESPTAADRELMARWPDALRVITKGDLPRAAGHDCLDAIRCSAVTGEGLRELGGAISARLVPTEPPATGALPVTGDIARWLRECLTGVEDGGIGEARERVAAWLDGGSGVSAD